MADRDCFKALLKRIYPPFGCINALGELEKTVLTGQGKRCMLYSKGNSDRQIDFCLLHVPRRLILMERRGIRDG